MPTTSTITRQRRVGSFRKTKTRDILTVEGVEELVAKLERIGTNLENAVSDAVDAGGKIVQKEASKRAPVATDAHHGKPPGTLKRNIIRVTETEGFGAGVAFRGPSSKVGPSSEAWYGIFPEVGTAHSAAQPYLRPALDSKRDEVEKAIAKVLREAIRDAVRGAL